MKNNLDLSRTAAAIIAYDAFDATYDNATHMTCDEAIAWFDELEQLGEAVGIAFGLDTADRNSMDTCKACVRPGPKVPAPGFATSFVRRMVAKVY